MALALSANAGTWNAGNSDWNTAANWLPVGVPNAAVAQIDNGGTANLTANALSPITNLRIGYGTGGTTGTLNVGANLTATAASEIGRSGNGTLNINSGANLQLPGTTSIVLRFGVLAGGIGTGVQSGGTVGVAGTVSIGVQGEGFYTMSGGTFWASNNFTVAGSSGKGTLTQNGGDIIVGSGGSSGQAYVGQATSPGAIGVFNLSGGTFKASSLSLGTGASGSGTITQTGGTLDLMTAPSGAGSMVIGPVGTGSYSIQNGIFNAVNLSITNGSFNVKNGATITLTGDLNLGGPGSIDFTFDSTGDSTINVGGVVALDPAAEINVDGSAYTGGAGSFTLIDALSFDNTPVINVSGFGGGASYLWDTINGNFIVTVPEPQVATIVGLGMLALLGRFRRQARDLKS